jgi:hypothetical protein
MAERMGWRHSALVTALAFAPVALTWTLKVLVNPRPFWAWLYDPEASYLHAGLSLLRGAVPYHIEHPGTPVQMLSAVLLWFDRGRIVEMDGLRVAAYSVSLGLSAVALLVLSRTVLLQSHPAAAVAAIWTYFLCPQALEYLNIWCPEALFLFVAALALAAAWKFFRTPHPLWAALAGAAVGLCLATKVTFLGWLLALLLTVGLEPGRSAVRALRVAASMLGALLGFVLATFPIAQAYPRLLAWLLGRASHAGQYGDYGTAAGSWHPRAAELVHNLLAVMGSAKAWHVLLGVAVVLAAWHLRAERDSGPGRRLVRFALLAAAPTFMLLLRDPSLRYLLPAAPAAIVLVAAIPSSFRPSHARACALGLLLLTGSLLAKAVILDLRVHATRIAQQTSVRARLDALIGALRKERPRTVVIYSWRQPEPSYALRLICFDPGDLAAIAARYPDEGNYESWTRTLRLPPGAERWDLIVLGQEDKAAFPGRLGASAGSVDDYEIFRAPEPQPALQ